MTRAKRFNIMTISTKDIDKFIDEKFNTPKYYKPNYKAIVDSIREGMFPIVDFHLSYAVNEDIELFKEQEEENKILDEKAEWDMQAMIDGGQKV